MCSTNQKVQSAYTIAAQQEEEEAASVLMVWTKYASCTFQSELDAVGLFRCEQKDVSSDFPTNGKNLSVFQMTLCSVFFHENKELTQIDIN